MGDADELFLALRATRAAVTAMMKQGGGAIVNVASVNAFFQPDTGIVDYGAAKAALVNLTKALSQELGPHGIRINDVSPGPVSTDLWLGAGGVAQTVAKATGVDAETAKKNVLASIGGVPTGRLTTPEEVAALVLMLSSKRTANVTGSNFVIDGGLIKTRSRERGLARNVCRPGKARVAHGRRSAAATQRALTRRAQRDRSRDAPTAFPIARAGWRRATA
jgi:NAD(P)-dependent dehydrogenase (short-subunit alcohol dehydrogenase family)